MIAHIFRPNTVVSTKTYQLILVVSIAILLTLWSLAPTVIPSPIAVWQELTTLVMHGGLLGELWVSLKLNIEAIVLSTIISLIVSYLSVVPATAFFVNAIAKSRFISLVGISFMITVFFGGGHILKLIMLTIGMTVFFVTSMADVVQSVTADDLDYARTLRLTSWEVWWEMQVRGTVGSAFDVLRQNAAMGWLMLTMVESISRSEGGIGKMLMDQEKHFSLAAILAIQAVFLLMGILQDAFIQWAKVLVAPYSILEQAKR